MRFIKNINKDPKKNDFSKQELIINVNEGSLFFKSDKGLHKSLSVNEDNELVYLKGTINIPNNIITSQITASSLYISSSDSYGSIRPITIGKGATPGGSTGGSISSRGSSTGGWANYACKFLGGVSLTDHGGFYGYGVQDTFYRWGVAPRYDNHNGLHVVSDGNNATEVKVGIGTYSPTDTLHVAGGMFISGAIIPAGSGSHDLGSSTNPWRDLHILSSSIKFYDSVGSVGSISFEKGIGIRVQGEDVGEDQEVLQSSLNLLNITASGDISASGNLITTHVTASGNISSSGNIYVNGVYTSGAYRLIDAGGTFRHIITNGSDDLRIEVGNVNMTSGMSLIGNVTASGNISSSGNIIASGDLYGTKAYITTLQSNTDITYTADADGDEVGQHIFKDRATVIATIDETGADFISHITASGNISASGNIYGRQFEQIETNFSANIGAQTGDFVFLPWTDTDTEKDYANAANKFVNRAVVAPGRPVKSVMRGGANTSLATAGAATEYTMSVWRQDGSDPGGSMAGTDLISVMEVYAASTNLNREHVTFDWRNPNSGSAADVEYGDRVWMGLETTNGNAAYIITHIWEWDYGDILG